MTVKELIQKLQKCDPNAIVVGYDYIQESDFIIDDVESKVFTPNDIKNEEYNYTKCDSVVEMHSLRNIVYLL